jgi:hypothetical protein
VQEPALEHGTERGERLEVRVVADGLARHGDVHRMVEVVVPLGGDPDPVRLARADDPRVVEVALGV